MALSFPYRLVRRVAETGGIHGRDCVPRAPRSLVLRWWADRQGGDPGSDSLEPSPTGLCRMEAFMTSPTEINVHRTTASCPRTGVEPAGASPSSAEPL